MYRLYPQTNQKSTPPPIRTYFIHFDPPMICCWSSRYNILIQFPAALPRALPTLCARLVTGCTVTWWPTAVYLATSSPTRALDNTPVTAVVSGSKTTPALFVSRVRRRNEERQRGRKRERNRGRKNERTQIKILTKEKNMETVRAEKINIFF